GAEVGERLGVVPEEALHRVLLQFLGAAEVGEAVPHRGRQHAAEVQEQRPVVPGAPHRIAVHMADEAIERTDAAIDQPSLEAWFAGSVAEAEPPLRFERISGGRSNLTYAVHDSGRRHWALPRPPLGARLAPAHDMTREHPIIS